MMEMLTSVGIAYAVCSTLTLFVDGSNYPDFEPHYHYPVVRNKPYTFPTYVPIAFTSSSAIPVSLPALKFDIYRHAKLLVKNDGRTVTFYPYNCEAATVTGGPVFKDKYIFEYMKFRSDGVPNNTRTSDTLDGRGFPIIFYFGFYNKRYGSFNNSLNYRDGSLTITCPVIVEGNVGNALFTSLERVLYRIRQPYSTALIYVKEALYWLLTSLTTGDPYYCYPGAHIDSAGKFYFSTNEVHKNFHDLSWVSYSQYKVFTQILNIFGQPQVGSNAVFPLGPRPFVETRSPVYVNCR